MDTEREYDVLSVDCPSRMILNRIGDRWTLLIIVALSREVLRFSQLRARVGGATPKVLTQTLRALERDGLVSREVFPVVPPRVEYRLTELGRSLLEPIAAVKKWAETHVEEVLEARERADAMASAASEAMSSASSSMARPRAGVLG
ncbi:helix-turn-helix transcriptional regulator [Planotetraspora sp. A-T 1434]|uniref:winged helix-turn-helix transcriptional regulator n=1 Tax=Planotetraspora sp. A-T 1434 TaxID=2979219 RepID=UPI0021BE9E8E|nr:helix-turn-helix domain-containing protein [Planotetraspora sp. A-T 1434]MCT9931104.1 helix-turn-helix transcriptional regulator [Planotetraspora sp. A-T 1434]